MKCLIVGGSGFVGTRLVGTLLKAGHKVQIYDKVKSEAYPSLTIIGDVRKKEDLVKALDGIDIVYMLAAEHRDDVSPVSLYYDVNVGGAENLTYATEHNNIKKIIFISSVAVYPLNAKSTKEDSIVAPFNDYGKSKLQAEKVFCEWYKRGKDRALIIVRPSVIFGENNIGNVFNLIDQIRKKRFFMVGNGKNKKSMAYIGNITKFLMDCADLPVSLQLINYADKPDLSTKELVGFLQTKLGVKSEGNITIPYTLGLVAGYFFDVLALVSGKKLPLSSVRIKKFCASTVVETKNLQSMRFKAPYTIEDGLSRMIDSM